MDTSLYKSFITISETGSLTRAASILHIAQPTLTRHIKILQKKYKTQLIKTGPGQRHIEITPAGQILYKSAKNLIAIENSIEKDIINCTNGARGTIHIAISSSLTSGIISASVIPFTKIYPDTYFDFQEHDINKQMQLLKSGIAELGLCNKLLPQPELFDTHLTCESRLAIYINKKSKLLNNFVQNDVFIDDEKKLLKFPIKSLKSTLLNVPFCTIPESQELIANYCKTLFISTNPLSISTSKSTALQWALENRAIVFAPLSPGEPVPGDLKVYILPSDMFRCYRFLYTLKNRELSPITQKFVDFLIDQHFKEGHYHSFLNILKNI
ncbi:LysR family transcriptional regulator [Dialister micraerophilus]|uniref:LysR family transcriptional regulator n=1 Tax=Dialister micraerophilus TaxID=309120 RepID=UPI0023F39FD5|nr:LysR family transcriptional regulator [Dialister micraerophilus]